MAVRKILQSDNPILRRVSLGVEEIDESILKLIDDMADTMYNSKIGAGLSACQIGVLKRVVVIDDGTGLMKLINPRIVRTRGRQYVTEGCLSFPKVWGKLYRPKKVIVKALNEKGQEIMVIGEKFLAKCLCHEIDHLDGILFTDKVVEYED